MEWSDAKQIIQLKIKEGTNVNSESSTFRFVKSVDSLIESKSYGYRNQTGFVIQIGTNNKINIPWCVLQECFQMLQCADGYSGISFRKRFPLQATHHPCHVHVIGQVFVKAGLAEERAGVYWPL